MVATDKVFAGSIPEIYERLLVPLIFQSYALDLAARLARFSPRHVLETAAGTGVLDGLLRAPEACSVGGPCDTMGRGRRP